MPSLIDLTEPSPKTTLAPPPVVEPRLTFFCSPLVNFFAPFRNERLSDFNYLKI